MAVSATTSRRQPKSRQPAGGQLAECSGLPDFLSRINNQEGTSLESRPIDERIFALISEDLTGGNTDLEAKQGLADARQKCRDGNPFHLIALQWPHLVLDDPAEIDIFEPHHYADRFDHLPSYLLDVVLNSDNPPLRIDWWQRVILAGIFSTPIGEIAIKGCTGAGKGFAVSVGSCLWYDAFESSRQHITSRSFDHAQTNFFGEVRSWFHRMRLADKGNVLNQSIGDNERHYVKILNPSPSAVTAGEAFSGAHGPGTVYVFDEASAVPDEFVNNAQKNAMMIIALSNPRTLFGWFRDWFKPLGDMQDGIDVCPGTVGMRLCVTVGGNDCANVIHERLRRPVAPIGGIQVRGTNFDQGTPIPKNMRSEVKPLIENQIDAAQFRAICSKPDQREVDVFAHGKFPLEDPQRQVIMTSWLDRHIAAWTPDIAVDAFGLDVARSKTGNSTCLAAGGSSGLRKLHLWQSDSVLDHAEKVIRIASDEYGIDLTKARNPVCVDTDVLGAGTLEMLQRYGVWVIEFHGGIPSQVAARQYKNWRTEAYATLGRRLNPDDQWGKVTWALPPGDNELYVELTAPEKIYQRNDALRFGLTPKRKPQGVQTKSDVLSVEEKIGRSPDKGDATVYLFVAVRMLHNMNEFFASFSGPLVYTGGDGDESGELAAAMKAEREREKRAKDISDGVLDPGNAAISEWLGDLTWTMEPDGTGGNGAPTWADVFQDDW